MCDGGLTNHIVLPARKLHPAPKLSLEQSALVETLAIGCHAVDRGAAKPGENVLVIGAGPIGLSALEFVKVSGARPIVADISENRLEFVRSVMKVPDTIQVTGDEIDLKKMDELTGGQRADLVIDATGNNRSMARAMEFAAFAGRVVYVGITQQNLDFPHAPFLHRRELTILASRNALSRDFTRIIDLIGEGRINTDPWITHHGQFDEVPDLFPTWIDPNAGVMKAIIHID
jgi:alcohol dehydrogenase